MLPTVAAALVPASVGHVVILVGSFLLLLLGAEIFTNGIEWFGHRLGVSESATGSVLAAVGTALPETMIPVIAIVQQSTAGGSAADEVGVGAILGAPFMLATIAMFLVGASALYFRDRRRSGATLHYDAESTRRDLSFFLVGYTLAFLTALVHEQVVHYVIGVVLVLLYVVYLQRSLAGGEGIASGGLEALHFGLIADEVVERLPGPNPVERLGRAPSTTLVVGQTVVALACIVGGAHLFVQSVEWASTAVFGAPAAVIALLLAPLATELPEKFNSVLWLSRDKDTLALGNITGAMAFQGTLPVTLGIAFTSWNLSLAWGTTGFLNGLSAVLAIASGGILYLRTRSTGGEAMRPRPFLLGGLFYLLFLAIVGYHLLAFDLSVVPH